MLILFFGILAPLSLGLTDAQELGRGTKDSKFFYHLPPDPVNVRTLNYYFPADDHLSLPCFLPIEIKINYNSYSGDTSIFGDKWTFNHNIKVSRLANRLEVTEGDGFQNPYYKERNLEATKESEIEQIIIAQKKADALAGGLKQGSQYEELKRKLRADQTLREETAAKMLKPVPLQPGEYYSLARGPTTLELLADGSYVRKFQNGAKEFFDKSGMISRTEDRNGNYLTYVYSGGNLARINDMCGRNVSFIYQQDPTLKGLIQKLSDSTGREIKYEFTPGRRLLKAYTDYNGRRVEFDYERTGYARKLTSTKPNGQTDVIELEYNDKFEVTAQKGPGTKVTKYKRSFVANNQSHSITEILKYDGTKLEGKELHEFKLKEFENVTKFDAAGKEISREIKTISKETGYPVSILNETGAGEKFAYDPKTGNLLRRETVPSGDVMTFEYEARCNQVNKIITIKKDGASSVMSFKFDPVCNLKEAEEVVAGKRSVWIVLEYLKTGKLSFIRDKTGNREIAFTYWTYGKPESITLKDVGTLMVKYSPLGEIQQVDTFPHGKGIERFKGKTKIEYQSFIIQDVRGALDGMLTYLRPAGLNIGL